MMHLRLPLLSHLTTCYLILKCLKLHIHHLRALLRSEQLQVDLKELHIHHHLRALAGSEQLQVDLKGTLFNTTIMPLAGTALVVNIGPSEAKVGEVCDQVLSSSHFHACHADRSRGFSFVKKIICKAGVNKRKLQTAPDTQILTFLL